MIAEPLQRLEHLTFKGNLKATRYGWLRLTPAYSVHLVTELLESTVQAGERVLDPFCGTGTTALVCAERGIRCDTTDINPFLLWLARVKTATYTPTRIRAFEEKAAAVRRAMLRAPGRDPWIPPLHQIEKWWDTNTLGSLARGMVAIRSEKTGAVADLLKIAFCRTMIARANVSFGHQSMSFKKPPQGPVLFREPSEAGEVAATWSQAVEAIACAATSEILAEPTALLCDSRDLRSGLKKNTYHCVITSPPYPNRMSYIRELRPYMYWLDYLDNGRAPVNSTGSRLGGSGDARRVTSRR